MRLSRTCYDKPHRCPGSRGGGWGYAAETKCPAEFGHITVAGGPPALGLRTFGFGHCDSCGVVTWPFASRYLDPTWWRHPHFFAPRWTNRLEVAYWRLRARLSSD